MIGLAAPATYTKSQKERLIRHGLPMAPSPMGEGWGEGVSA